MAYNPNRFYHAICQGDVPYVRDVLEKNAKAGHQVLFLRFEYDNEEGYRTGGWGMPVWKHVCNAISDKKMNVSDPGVQEACALVGRRTSLGDVPTQKWVLMAFALRARWPALVREALDSGVPPPEIEDRDRETWGKEICDLIETYRDVPECAICLERAATSHTSCPCKLPVMCETCESQLREKKCPICRTAY